MYRHILAGVLLVVANCIYAQCNCSSASSPVSFAETGNASITLNKNQWVIETYADYRSFNRQRVNHNKHYHSTTENSSPESESKSVLIASGVLRYGLTNRITLSVQQPVQWLNSTIGNINGSGDLLFTATIKLFDKNYFAAAFVTDIELPTGTRSISDGKVNMSAGSGSYDPLGAIAIEQSWNNFFIRTNFLYKYSTVGFEKINVGSFMSHNITVGYRLKTAQTICTTDTINVPNKKISWSVFSGIPGEWTAHGVKENVTIINTGAYTLFLQAGSMVGFGKWSFSGSFGFPLIQKLTGEQNAMHYRTRIGIIKTF